MSNLLKPRKQLEDKEAARDAMRQPVAALLQPGSQGMREQEGWVSDARCSWQEGRARGKVRRERAL